MKERVLIGPSTFGAMDPRPIKALLAEGCEIINNPFGRKLTKKELMENLRGVTGLIAGLEILDKGVLEKSALKVISRCGAGMDSVDLKTAGELGIKVYSTPRGPTLSVAELTLCAMLCLLRHIPQMDKDLHEGKWAKRIGSQLNNKTVVIIGFGRIGRSVARLLRAFDAKIIVVDPNITPKDLKNKKIKLASLNKALPQADIVSLHANCNKEIFGRKEFALMKKGTFLLNSARGGLLDESALALALTSGRLAGAWLDSFKEEPYKGPLKKYRQVLLTPHIGSYSSECRYEMEMEAVDNLIRGFRQFERRRK